MPQIIRKGLFFMNRVFLLGRLTKDVVFKELENGTKIANYSLAIPIRGKKDEADFISCKAFGDTAVFANEHLKKGQRILVEAHLKPNNYTNKDDVKVYGLDVIVDNHYFADGTGKFGITEDGLFTSVEE